ncbi:MAG TPA: hypothetical protein VE825_03685 [Terriglobales bacterium]|jgi:hypothetical protein|nr:hypothetical protein [Terriglobales bacterium]
MTPEEEKALLLRVVIKVARLEIQQSGGLVPFGATLGSKRDVCLLRPKEVTGTVTRDKLEDYWKREFGKAAAAGECRTVCCCADVRVARDQGGSLVPALLIHIEHVEAGGEDVVYPHWKGEDSEVVLGEATGVPVTWGVFQVERQSG